MNEELMKQRKEEIFKHKLIITLTISLTITLGYIILNEKISTGIQPNYFYFLIEFIFITSLFIYYFCSTKTKFKVDYIIGIILCSIFSISICMLLFTKTDFYQLYSYLITQIIYHYSEYISVLIYHFDTLDYQMFLLDHSKEWIFSLIVSYIESILGTIFFKNIKQNKIIFRIGIVITIFGQFFRIGSLYTAKLNFTHLLSYEKKKEHFLMTTGFYGISRHPSYFGFLVWSIGTQLMCCNPICAIGFPIGLFIFFKDRILEEEGLLIEFFGNEYIEYKKHVGILIPFIHMSKEEEIEHLEVYMEKHINEPFKLNKEKEE
jgi:protein-S-isoprenylcysteine O-methyltransferase